MLTCRYCGREIDPHDDEATRTDRPYHWSCADQWDAENDAYVILKYGGVTDEYGL
jgi:hypothetical protein